MISHAGTTVPAPLAGQVGIIDLRVWQRLVRRFGVARVEALGEEVAARLSRMNRALGEAISSEDMPSAQSAALVMMRLARKAGLPRLRLVLRDLLQVLEVRDHAAVHAIHARLQRVLDESYHRFAQGLQAGDDGAGDNR